jgi:hypothetical protein
MDEINKLSVIKEFAEQIKRIPEAVSSSFSAYLQGKYDLDDLQEKAEHPELPHRFGMSDNFGRKQLAC